MGSLNRWRHLSARIAYLLSAVLLIAAFWPASGVGPEALAQPAAAATRTPIFPNAVLSLAGFSFDCASASYQATFTVSNIDPAIVKTFGTVDYAIGPLQHAAGFTEVQGSTATYVDHGTLPHQATQGNVVNISNAKVTLGTDRGDAVLTADPGTLAIKCAVIGTATATAATNTPTVATNTPTETVAATAVPTSTPTGTVGATAAPTATETATEVPTATQVATEAPTATEIATATSAATTVATAVPTATSTAAATEVVTAVPTSASNTGGAGQPPPSTLPVTGVDTSGRTTILLLLSLLFLGVGVTLTRLFPTTKR